MAVIDLFSKRLEKLKNQNGENYYYDQLPPKLRQQIWDIVEDTFIESLGGMCRLINKILCHEYGISQLCNVSGVCTQVKVFTVQNYNINEVLDAVELFFNDGIFKNIEGYDEDVPKLKEAIKELNDRFKEHNIGYQFQANQIIRVDSMYMQSEVVEPALALINNSKFEGACDEYMKAHKHYKNGNNQECLSECLKAFESTMKIICKEKGWSYDKDKDVAKKLISICRTNGLFPEYMENQYNHLEGILAGGVPTNRNRNSGHGQGDSIRIVTDPLTRYTLNLTGSNIIFLIEQSAL